MARSKGFFDDVKNHLECSVCQEQFSEINEPKILKCLHTFCKTCLEAWLRQQREGKLSCPTCRQITECPNNIQSLPSNLFCKQLVEIVEAYSGQGQEDSPHCGICDETKALKFYCSDCNSFSCDDCVSDAHKKGKVFKGHHVKEIGNFESSDVQGYARRTNVCKEHKDEMRFYCERCQICICRDCAILEHQDHNKISLDQGLENNKSEIETKMRQVKENGSRLRSYKDTLEKRRLQVNGNIEEATNEVKRVAERCILLIRQHEASVTERLVEQKAAFQDAYDNQMTSVNGKLVEIDNTLAFSEEVLLRNNLPEVLNVKSTIEKRLQELSVPFEAMPKLGFSGVKYVQSDVSFLKDAPRQLVTTDTEPSLSVAEGKSLTEGLVGEDCSFTVITKNSAGQKTYSEIDELNVKITSLSKDELKTVVTDLKDGRYSVCYRPTTPGKFRVSIEVEGNEIMGSPFKLEVGTRSQYPKQEKTTPLKSTKSRIMCDNSDASIEQAGKVKVSVYKGDITNERVDVIVNAANRDLQHVGGVAKAILDKGGKKIKEESQAIIKSRGTLKDGEAVNTKSGNLPCKAVVHAVGPVWKDVGPKKSKNVLRRACLNSFTETEKLNMTSIALPAIGSGIYGMPKDVCAEVMFDAVDEFVRQGGAKKKKITDIRFVNIDDPSVQAFTKEFNNRYGEDWEGSSDEKATGVDTSRFSTTGFEGGGPLVPTLRSDHGRGHKRNNPHSHPHPHPGAVSASNNDHPLVPSGHHESSNSPYSNAVKGKTGGHDPRPSVDQQPRGRFSHPPKGSDGSMTDKKEEETCPICLDPISSPRSLKCKHVFCSGCIQTALDVCNKCPVCQEPQGVLKGNQPRGEMRNRTERYSVPGYGGYGTIVIDYFFPWGVQGPEHPNPGQRYQGTSRTAYLPDTREGREVLQLLKRAFDARLVFTVGTSITTGMSNQVIWNDIHHKTSVHGDSYGFGYPDPDYLRRVKEELAAKGIR